MQRSQIRNFLDRIDDFVVDHHRGCELLAAMDDAVADCTDLVERFQDTGLLIGQSLKYKADCFVVVRHGSLIDFLTGIAENVFISNDGTVNADSLAQALCQKSLCSRIDDLEFQ